MILEKKIIVKKILSKGGVRSKIMGIRGAFFRGNRAQRQVHRTYPTEDKTPSDKNYPFKKPTRTKTQPLAFISSWDSVCVDLGI